MHDWKMTDQMEELGKRQDRVKSRRSYRELSARSCRFPSPAIWSVIVQSCIFRRLSDSLAFE